MNRHGRNARRKAVFGGWREVAPNPHADDLQVLLSQHWEHARHVEGQRVRMMSLYTALLGGLFYFLSTDAGAVVSKGKIGFGLFSMAFLATVFALMHTKRWSVSFECYRSKVDLIVWIMGLPAETRDSIARDAMKYLDMAIPRKRFNWRKLLDVLWGFELSRMMGLLPSLRDLFRTRYLFLLFYFGMLLVLSLALGNSFGLSELQSTIGLFAAVVVPLAEIISFREEIHELHERMKEAREKLSPNDTDESIRQSSPGDAPS